MSGFSSAEAAVALAFDVSTLTTAQKEEILRQVSLHSMLPKEKMEALYVVLGDDLFFVLFLLSGDEIHFPLHRTLKRIYTGVISQQEGLNG
jgi:hypothetical protein